MAAGLAAGLAADAQAPPASAAAEDRAELVLRGGAVFTADTDTANPAATAVAVRGRRIVYVGDDEGVRRFVGNGTRTIDIGEGMVLPGFHDSHVHVAVGGLGLATCDPTGPAWLPDEAVSVDAMLLAYTINGARLQLHEEETGSITVGKAADLVVLDRDLRSIPAVL